MKRGHNMSDQNTQESVNNETVVEDVTTSGTTETPQYSTQQLPHKSKMVAGLLHLLLGGIGVGNFYMGKVGLGIVDILFCWTCIPGIVNFVRGIIILCGSDEAFAQKYNVIVDKC